MVYIGRLCAECSLIKYVLTSIRAGGSCKWVNDSQRLLLELFDTVCAAPSHVYHTALPLSPSSWLHESYSIELSQEVRVVKGLPTEWGMCFRTVTLGTTLCAIAHWKDTIAVGCWSGDITVLGGITGSQTAVLSGHTYVVTSLTFSSDCHDFCWFSPLFFLSPKRPLIQLRSTMTCFHIPYLILSHVPFFLSYLSSSFGHFG